jgi:hypothetical protein
MSTYKYIDARGQQGGQSLLLGLAGAAVLGARDYPRSAKLLVFIRHWEARSTR